MTFYREEQNGVDPIWEYCRQQQYNRLRKRVRVRQLRFIVAWSIIAVIITFWAMWLKG